MILESYKLWGRAIDIVCNLISSSLAKKYPSKAVESLLIKDDGYVGVSMCCAGSQSSMRRWGRAPR
jgi:hypothetical protein